MNTYRTCPFMDVHVFARICSVYTRVELTLQDDLPLNFTDLSNAYRDCGKIVDWLPWTIYIPFGGSYNFSVEFQLQMFGV